MYYAVVDEKGKVITVLVDDGKYCDYYGPCGGCFNCLKQQAEYSGYNVILVETMDNKYGDGSDCQCCPKCGYCLTCGDCDEFGCGQNDSSDGTDNINSDVIRTYNNS